jgi:hypothetical protein
MAKTNTTFSDRFKDLKEKAATTQAATPIQKVIAVPTKASNKKIDNDKEEPFTFWTTKDKMKKLKLRAIEEGTSVKDLINQALDTFLE